MPYHDGRRAFESGRVFGWCPDLPFDLDLFGFSSDPVFADLIFCVSIFADRTEMNRFHEIHFHLIAIGCSFLCLMIV